MFGTAFLIACKHSGVRLLCLLGVFAACLALLFGTFSALPEQDRPPATVAVVNKDDNPLTRTLLGAMTSLPNLSDLFTFQVTDEATARAGDYTAVLTVPAGFLDSVLDGTNHSPTVTVDVSTPLEAMWVRQLATAGASALTTAQRGIYTVQETVDYGAGMPAEAYERLLADVNLTFMKAFLNRLSLLSLQPLSATGALSLPLYYAAAATALLFLAYGFLYSPAVRALRDFSVRRRVRGLYAAAAVHVLLFTGILAGVASALMRGLSGSRLVALLLFLALTGGWSMAICLLFRTQAACACASVLLTLGMGMLCGGFLPLALMPAGLAQVAGLLPGGQAISLACAMFGEPLAAQTIVAAAITAAVLWGASALLWRRGAD